MISADFTEADIAIWISVLKVLPHQDSTGFMEWFEGPLRRFFPFEKALLVQGELIAGEIRMSHWINSGHETRYLQQIAMSFELSQRGSVRWWLANQQPFGIDPACPDAFVTAFEVEEIRNFELGRIAAHGVINIKANAGSYFSFAGIPKPISDWHRGALRLIAPVLNDLFVAHLRAKSLLPGLALDCLTSRQRDIVRQLADGLPDKTIARNLGIAAKTVRNQLATIYCNVGVHNRAQLIALLR